jgi:peroxiredoxin
MKHLTLIAAAFALTFGVATVDAKPVIGQAAPDFTVTDSNGAQHKLADFAGKTVVLEWHNPECPFVKKHYGANNMQAQQAAATGDGVVWLTVNSGKAGKQGHLDGAAANAYLASAKATPTAYAIDGNSEVGEAYAAKTTPHMYVIDGKGTLRYMGAIDSNSSSDPADIAGATQYVPQVLAELASNKAVSVTTTQPYGCSVKY